MKELAREYLRSADQVEERITELRAQLKHTRGEEAFRLQRRIEVLTQELADLRIVYRYLLRNYIVPKSQAPLSLRQKNSDTFGIDTSL